MANTPRKATRPDVDYGRLYEAHRNSRLVLKKPRENRAFAVREFVGSNWMDEGSDRVVPLNLIAQYVQIVTRSLVAKNPRVMLSTHLKDAKPVAAAMESWANSEIERLYLANVLQRWVLDALFCIGICKVALATPADAAIAGYNMRAGTPFAEVVDFDDFTYDIHARNFESVGFVGHRFRAPLDSVKDSTIYSSARRKLEQDTNEPYNREGDQKVTSFGRMKWAFNAEEFEPHVDLWEFYLPRRRLVVTVAEQQLGADEGARLVPLREQEWVGPDCGPYHFLGFQPVPGNPLPKAPVQDLLTLHGAVNALLRKTIRQGERQKEVLLIGQGASEDGQRIVDANDGEAIRADHPEQSKSANYGGPNQQVFALLVALKDMFSWNAGNLDIMGGLSPQSKTASQDRMLDANSAKSVSDMQDTTTRGVTSVLTAMLWFWHHDPYRTFQSVHQLPGVPDLSITRHLPPNDRQQVRFEDLQLNVDPYSLQHATPQARLAQLNQLVQTIILPAMPILQQQGCSFDIAAYLAKIAKYADLPDLPEIVQFQEPPSQDGGSGGGGSEPPGMPNSTTRTYERVNRPGGTREGKDQTLVASLMGANPQPSEMAAVGRPNS